MEEGTGVHPVVAMVPWDPWELGAVVLPILGHPHLFCVRA